MNSPAEPRSLGNLPLLAAVFVAGLSTLAGLTVGRGASVLVLVAACLLAAISSLWSSLHEAAAADELGDSATPTLARLATDDELEAVLRALLDLDHEVAVGKILADDEAVLRRELRDEAKRLIQLQDARIDPAVRARAAAIVEAALASADVPEETNAQEKTCRSCRGVVASDDAFCKRCGAKISATVGA